MTRKTKDLVEEQDITPEEGEAQAPEAKDEQAELKKWSDIALRAQADLVNYRRRVSDERKQDRVREVRRFGLHILPILDQLEAALENKDGVEEGWHRGVEAVLKNFQSVLAQEGFERFDALNCAFNPAEHEAVLQQPSDKHKEGEIVAQIRVGYRHSGEVVRPAQVVIATAAVEKDAEVQGQDK